MAQEGEGAVNYLRLKPEAGPGWATTTGSPPTVGPDLPALDQTVIRRAGEPVSEIRTISTFGFGPGDLIEISGGPEDDGIYRVTAVEHASTPGGGSSTLTVRRR